MWGTATDPEKLSGQMVVPVPRHSGLPRAGVRVTSQHFEGGRLSSPVNSQQTEALMAQKAIRLTHTRWNTLQGGEKDDVRSCEPLMSIRDQINATGCNNILEFTSPGATPTQIRSTAALFLPT